MYPEASLCFTQFFNVPQRMRAVREDIRSKVHPTGAALPGPLPKRETFTIRAATCLQRASLNCRRVSSAPLSVVSNAKQNAFQIDAKRVLVFVFRAPGPRQKRETFTIQAVTCIPSASLNALTCVPSASLSALTCSPRASLTRGDV